MGQTTAKRRLFAADLTDCTSGAVQLSPDQAHHAANVLRLRSGEAVELFDGRGAVAQAQLTQVRKSKVGAQIQHIDHIERDRPLIHLGFALPKGKRLDWLLEKATELGAASLQPVDFERSVVGRGQLQVSDAKLVRWQGHCISAATQCRLNFLPELCQPQPLDAFLAQGGQTPGILGDCADDAPAVAGVLSTIGDAAELRLLVGPEGDFTPAEHAAALDAGMLPARLGRTTLRVETAAIALLAVASGVLRA